MNSLLSAKNSLSLKIVSLLIFTGNFWRSYCSTGLLRSEIGAHRPKIAKFAVKFPVSREFGSRRVRSALCRQPGSAALLHHGSPPKWKRSLSQRRKILAQDNKQ